MNELVFAIGALVGVILVYGGALIYLARQNLSATRNAVEHLNFIGIEMQSAHYELIEVDNSIRRLHN